MTSRNCLARERHRKTACALKKQRKHEGAKRTWRNQCADSIANCCSCASTCYRHLHQLYVRVDQDVLNTCTRAHMHAHTHLYRRMYADVFVCSYDALLVWTCGCLFGVCVLVRACIHGLFALLDADWAFIRMAGKYAHNCSACQPGCSLPSRGTIAPSRPSYRIFHRGKRF